MKFIAECFIVLDIDVEGSKAFKKFLITKKQHYIGISEDEDKDPEIKGMEGIELQTGRPNEHVYALRHAAQHAFVRAV